MIKWALGIEYNGAQYSGWQKQKHANSVQENIENALSEIAQAPITIYCAGRTDSGVHATGQVVHFESDKERTEKAWMRGGNTKLPDEIRITWVKKVNSEFHARFSAKSRCYRYIIFNEAYRSAILPSGITAFHYPLDENKMHEGAQFLLGEQDFSSFRAAHCQANHAHRNIEYVNVIRQNKYIIVEIQANAFLHHMVRNIVGSLIKVGCREQKPEWIRWLLEQKDRNLAAETAKPNGLYLVNVNYPDIFEIPKIDKGPLFL